MVRFDLFDSLSLDASYFLKLTFFLFAFSFSSRPEMPVEIKKAITNSVDDSSWSKEVAENAMEQLSLALEGSGYTAGLEGKGFEYGWGGIIGIVSLTLQLILHETRTDAPTFSLPSPDSGFCAFRRIHPWEKGTVHRCWF